MALSPLVRKEMRALGPIWIAATAPLLLYRVIMLLPVGDPVAGPAAAFAALSAELLGVVAFVLGALSLGAMSVGHEYAHRTLAQLLVQPDRRARLFRTKRVVLVLFLLALTGVAAVTNLRTALMEPRSLLESPQGALLVLVPLLAYTTAPWLTMVFRRPLAGVVFTLAIPAALGIAGNVASSLRAGVENDASVDALRYAVLWIGVLATSGASALWGRQKFLRLEVREDDGAADVQMPAPGRTLERTRHAGQRVVTGPLTALVRKELRLQAIAIILAAGYVAIWVALLPFAPSETIGTTLFVVTISYAALVATQTGVIASAEERALGTLEWQLLQPQSTRTQWAVKVGIAVVLTLLLAFALPILLGTLRPQVGDEVLSAFGWAFRSVSMSDFPLRRLLGPAAALALITCCGVYVSSLSAAAVRAVILTWPLLAGVVVIPGVLETAASAAAWRVLGLQAYVDAMQRAFDAGNRQVSWLSSADASWWYTQVAIWLSVGSLAGLALLLLGLGYVNHCSAERDRRRIARQIAWILLFAVTSALAQGFAPNAILRAFATMP